MATTRSALRQLKPPSGLASLIDVSRGRVSKGSKINALGLVKDFRAPVQTGGKDWKCEIEIYDQSIEDEQGLSVSFNVFRPRAEMPDVECGDIVLVFNATVQEFRSVLSLCTNWRTDIHIYQCCKIPKPLNDASRALRPSNQGKINRRPNHKENEFVSAFNAFISKEGLPTATEFEDKKAKSINVRDKFTELKDARGESFIDTVAQIVRAPYDMGDKMTLWISDYTENSSFYHFEFMKEDAKGGEEKFNYHRPLGKRSMQVTCFEPHASAIRDAHLDAGAWIFLRNLRIRFGRNTSNLEGYLREDGRKINIWKECADDPEKTSSVVKNALRRKRDYEKSKKEQLKQLDNAALAGQKRRADLGLDVAHPPKKMNSRARRHATRAEKRQAGKQEQESAKGSHSSKVALDEGAPDDLNPHVRCENQGKPSTPIRDILQPVYHEATTNGNTFKFPLPFVNANYRTHVRVVNFMPSRLEDFARSRKQSAEYAALSDNGESESDAMSDSEDELGSLIGEGDDKAVRTWEWCFYLQLEEASSSQDQPKQSLWALVDNQCAQMLLDLDASDLRNDDENLGQLRQKLFLLWGELEEHKAKLEKRALPNRPLNHAKPPAHSDEEDESEKEAEEQPKQATEHAFSNRPFECCIRQFGVQVDEDDDEKADAGQGKRWKQMFGLFGARISAF